MTQQERRQRAEELARRLKVGKTVQPPAAKATGWPDFYADVPWNDGVSWIASALSDAYTEGRREALREAADAAQEAPLPRFYLIRNDAAGIAAWLRDRADDISREGQE